MTAKKMTLAMLAQELTDLSATASKQADRYGALNPSKLTGAEGFALAQEDKDFFTTLEELTDMLDELANKADDLAFTADLASTSA